MNKDAKPKTRLLLAVYTRELKTAFFLSLSGEAQVQIVATAVNTAELLSYARSFRPDVIVLEWELPGRPMAEVLPEIFQEAAPPKIFITSKPSSHDQIRQIITEIDLHIIDNTPEDLLNELAGWNNHNQVAYIGEE